MNTTVNMDGSSRNTESWLPLLELATREVFEIMLGCKLEAPPATVAVRGEFTAMVGLAGQLCGLLTLRCTSRSAAAMTGKMLNLDASEVHEQVWDAIGEVANMIAGNFKNKLTGISDSCMLSVPTVISGSDYDYHSMADTGPLEIILGFEGAPISVAVEIHS